MKIFTLKYFPSKILMTLALSSLAALSPPASAADDIPETDLTAPCGVLQLIGKESHIYNRSQFSLLIKFITKPMGTGILGYNHVDAGAVKYLVTDTSGRRVWRDDGVGDARVGKVYTVPVNPDETVTIAYCAASNRGTAVIEGVVSFKATLNGDQVPVLEHNISFTNFGLWEGVLENIKFTGWEQNSEYLNEPFLRPSQTNLIICQPNSGCED